MPAPDVTILSRETVWKGHGQLDIVRFQNRRFDGALSNPRTWEVWLRGQAVGVLPYDPVTDQLVMIEQFRYPAMLAGVDPIMREVPGGFRDSGETEEQTAAREMQEEMQLATDRLHRIGRFVLSAGGSDESVTIFAGRVTAPPVDAQGVAGFGGLASENEDIRVSVISATAAIEHALAGGYTNSITAIALLWFASKRDWLRAEWAA
jgi:ADP-ribose pyrophosphatase